MEVQKSLDTASKGDFASLTCEQAETLIANLAQSGAYATIDTSAPVHAIGISDAKIQELIEIVENLTSIIASSQKLASSPNPRTNDEGYDVCCAKTPEETREHCNYVDQMTKTSTPNPSSINLPRQPRSAPNISPDALILLLRDDINKTRLEQLEFMKETKQSMQSIQL